MVISWEEGSQRMLSSETEKGSWTQLQCVNVCGGFPTSAIVFSHRQDPPEFNSVLTQSTQRQNQIPQVDAQSQKTTLHFRHQLQA